jgi:hypothetical protein
MVAIKLADEDLPSIWRILKPVRLCKLCRGELEPRASRTPPAAYDAIGGLARVVEPGVETAFRDGYLRLGDLRKPLSSKL